MSGGESINLSPKDLYLVKIRIERCLQQYMHKNDVINALAINENVNRNLTELIWQQLEEENPEFFKAYYLRLLVKDQIMEFNRLISEQVDLMRSIGGVGGATPSFTSNASHVSPLQNIPILSCTAQNSRIPTTESIMHQQQQPNMYVDFASSIHPTTAQVTVGGSISPTFFQSNMGLAQGSSSRDIIPSTEALIYGDGLDFNFSPSPGDFADASVSSFRGLDDALFDGHGSSFGFLTQSFSSPELPADFRDISDVLGRYSRSPFIAPDADDFIDPNEDTEKSNTESGSLGHKYISGD